MLEVSIAAPALGGGLVLYVDLLLAQVHLDDLFVLDYLLRSRISSLSTVRLETTTSSSKTCTTTSSSPISASEASRPFPKKFHVLG